MKSLRRGEEIMADEDVDTFLEDRKRGWSGDSHSSVGEAEV
jgi:hypothetical protein